MTRTRFAIGFLLLCTLASVAPGSSGIEVIRDNAGGVRYETPSARETFPVPAAETAPLMPPRTGYLWLDTNHGAAVAENVAISGNGAYGFVGWWLNNQRAALYQMNGDNIPEWNRSMPLVQFNISVDADDLASRLTTTGRGDSLYVFAYSSSDPTASHWFSPRWSAITRPLRMRGTRTSRARG